MKNNNTIILICLFVLACTYTAHAQLPGFETTVNDEQVAAPIDGFIGIAMAVAAYFGVKKIRQKE